MPAVATSLDDDVMVKELPVANRTDQELRLDIRRVEQAYLGTDHRGLRFSMLPGDEWCVHAPGRDATFALQIEANAIVILVGGCDIDALDIVEHPTTESPARAIVPIDD